MQRRTVLAIAFSSRHSRYYPPHRGAFIGGIAVHPTNEIQNSSCFVFIGAFVARSARESSWPERRIVACPAFKLPISIPRLPATAAKSSLPVGVISYVSRSLKRLPPALVFWVVVF
jgi:hypothetical protein